MGMFAKGSIAADPTGEMLRLVSAFGAQAHPAMHDGVWVSPNQDRALLMVQTVAAGFDIDAQEHALQRIETAFATARQRGSAADRSIAANARLLETGPPVFAVRTRAHMKADVDTFLADRCRIGRGHPAVRLPLRAHPDACPAARGERGHRRYRRRQPGVRLRARHHPGIRRDADRRGRRLRDLSPHADRAGCRICRDARRASGQRCGSAC